MGEVCQATLERVGEDQKLGFSSKERQESYRLVISAAAWIAILHVCADLGSGTNGCTIGKETLSGMLDIEVACFLLSGLVC
jgi:hypothetical protein